MTETQPNLIPTGGKKHAPIQLIRDLESTSGYWAAIWTICAMPDAHVVCDAPIGCFNLIAQAVTDYTDAIPHFENLTPSTMREQEVTMTGTAGKVRYTVDAIRQLHPDREVIVVSTAESEMISSDHGEWLSRMQPPVPFFWSRSLEGDEYEGRDRVLVWLWEKFGKKIANEKLSTEQATTASDDLSQWVNVIGPTYGCFNSPSDLHEVKRLIEGAGGRLNLVYPVETTLKDTPRLADSAVNIVMYEEFGESLAKALGKPYLFAPMGINATTEFVLKLGDLLGTRAQAEAFIAREKKTTLLPLWDLWKGVQSDWFATTEFAVVASKTYTDGLVRLLADELGMKLQFAVSRPYQMGGMDNIAIRNALHKKQPGFVFGSINEKIYLTEAQARATFYVPASFPGAVVRRAFGTPFMGYSGAVYIVQEMVNRFYEIVYNFLPFDNVAAPTSNGNHQASTPVSTPAPTSASLTAARDLFWQDDARKKLDAHLENIPWLSRISATRELRTCVEQYALKNNLRDVTVEVVEKALAGG